MKIKYTILIITYFLNLFLPEFGTVDKAGNQWLYLSFLNIIYSYELFINIDLVKKLLRDKILLVLLIFSFSGLPSIINAYNSNELIIEFVRNFNVFYATLCISVFLIKGVNFKILFSSFLIISFIANVNVFSIIYEVFGFSSIEVSFANRIPGFTMNKNINSYLILSQLPFILGLIFYVNNKIVRLTSAAVLFMLFTVLFVYGTRSALLVLSFFTLILVFTSIFILKKNKTLSLYIIIPLILAFIFELKNNITTSSTVRLSSLNLEDSSVNKRLIFYKDAIDKFLEYPILGIGTGNWKIISLESLKYDLTDYIAPYHVHNDFLEVLSERGLVGFIPFILIFVFSLHRILVLDLTENKTLKYISMIGLFVFISDSMFNFPHNRPVIQVYFILFISILIYLEHLKNLKFEN